MDASRADLSAQIARCVAGVSTRRILNAEFIHLPKHLYLVVHGPGDVYDQACTWELKMRIWTLEVIRDEMSAKRASDSLLFCSFPT